MGLEQRVTKLETQRGGAPVVYIQNEDGSDVYRRLDGDDGQRWTLAEVERMPGVHIVVQYVEDWRPGA